MLEILSAIHAKAAGTTFSTSIGGRFFPLAAPIGTALPFAVFSVPTDVDDHTLHDSAFAEVEVLIDCVACSLTELKTITDAADGLFDGAALSVSPSQQTGVMSRSQTHYLSDENVFRVILEYEVTLFRP